MVLPKHQNPVKMGKVKIELRPYNALAILKFLREFVNDDIKHYNGFAAIYEAVNEYEIQVYTKTSISQLEDAILENKVNYLTGRCPPKR